jgi:hypothetical protein
MRPTMKFLRNPCTVSRCKNQTTPPVLQVDFSVVKPNYVRPLGPEFEEQPQITAIVLFSQAKLNTN